MSFDPYILNPLLSYVAAGAALLLAGIVAIKDRRSFANRSFIAGMALLAASEILRGISSAAITPDEMLYWRKMRLVFFALVPGTSLLFSLSFARQEYRDCLSRWKYVIAAAFLLPIIILLSPQPVLKQSIQELIPVSYTGKAFYCFVLIVSVLILTNLERTLRASTGRIRWQIKFIVLGMGIISAAWIYESSQILIYSAIDTSLSILQPVALLAASILFFWGLLRSQFLNVDVYLSRSTIQYSLTALLASLYLVVLGLLAYRARFFTSDRPLPYDALIVMVALAGLGMLLLSDRIQERIRRFVTRHFKRPLYDYRKAWMDLTDKTSALFSTDDLCIEVAKIISRTFGILSVNIWLCDEGLRQLSLAGSTVFTRAQAESLERDGDNVSQLLAAVEGRVLDLKEKPFTWAEEIMQDKPEYFADFKMRYILPIQCGESLVGIMTLNDDRVGRASLSFEDQDLLHAYASQLAARVLQLKLSENLRKAQEIEAFQNVSAFFVHDLKNLASRLSLTMQNLPAYFDNPAFRDDALKLIGQSLEKIDATCSRLSTLKNKIELRPTQVDLNELLKKTLDEFERSTRFQVEKRLHELPPVSIDSEQMQKVATNLVMNAYDAIKGKGSIRLETSCNDRQVTFSVSDTGCGMTQQFINKMLFRPFNSTKKKGLGIGLFHSKMIVEAHHGKIEVDSEEGKGSTFRVTLPLKT